MSDWIEIRATFDSSPEDWSPYVSCCEAHGCPSSQQQEQPPQLLAYLEDSEVTLVVANQLRDDLLLLGAHAVELSRTPEQDWQELWKQHFKPMRIGKRFVICPTWESYEPAESDLLIWIDPGQAFGTGDHATTRMCLELLEEYVPATTTSVLDIGTGSGILSIAASKLGVTDVIGTDIDPIAIEVARQNASRNEAACVLACAEGFDDALFSRTWPAIVSNIISATLIRLAPIASSKLEKGGIWIVSGIIEPNWADVLAAAERAGLSLVHMRQEADWVAAVLQRPASS